MAVEDTIRTVLGIIGNVISFCMFLAPVPTFYKIYKWRDTRGFSGIPYVMTILNCALWVLYGLPIVKPNSILVSTINGIGLVLQIIYTATFLIFCKDKKQKMKLMSLLLLITVFFAAVALLAILLAHTHKKRTLIVGLICIVFNVFMYASPLTIMVSDILCLFHGGSVKDIISTDKWSLISSGKGCSGEECEIYAVLSFYCFVCQWTHLDCLRLHTLRHKSRGKHLFCTIVFLAWIEQFVVYFTEYNACMQLPNGMGAGLGAAQLILYGAYYKTTKWGDADPPKAVEMDGGSPLPHGSAGYDAA
ncbi:hypothetical protein KI387_007983 [Taxus chinensis]|uniref:Bidirectional sugar transporter SWEET n=1 Tax=Taxus chinensis TaxID=29808 RepID=A0AA38FEW3_TAXCH|nr:hypothetical protein KI387_007983 [Taxus chinensis]